MPGKCVKGNWGYTKLRRFRPPRDRGTVINTLCSNMTFRALTPSRKYTFLQLPPHWRGTYCHLVRESTRPVKNVMGIYTDNATQEHYSLSISRLKSWKYWTGTERTFDILLCFTRVHPDRKRNMYIRDHCPCFFINVEKTWADLGNWVSTGLRHSCRLEYPLFIKCACITWPCGNTSVEGTLLCGKQRALLCLSQFQFSWKLLEHCSFSYLQTKKSWQTLKIK